MKKQYAARLGAILLVLATAAVYAERQNGTAASHDVPPGTRTVEQLAGDFPVGHWECWFEASSFADIPTRGYANYVARADRHEITYHRNADLESLGGDPGSFQRWGTGHHRHAQLPPTAAPFGPPQVRMLGVRTRLERNPDPDLPTLRNEVLELSAWSERRADEEIAFGILGDFNRRLAVSGDWTWARLSPGGHAASFSSVEGAECPADPECQPSRAE